VLCGWFWCGLFLVLKVFQVFSFVLGVQVVPGVPGVLVVPGVPVAAVVMMMMINLLTQLMENFCGVGVCHGDIDVHKYCHEYSCDHRQCSQL